eukprot:2396330-Rhodomonas_salina.3
MELITRDAVYVFGLSPQDAVPRCVQKSSDGATGAFGCGFAVAGPAKTTDMFADEAGMRRMHPWLQVICVPSTGTLHGLALNRSTFEAHVIKYADAPR